MRIHYLEIVTRDIDAVCATYAAATGVEFGQPDAGLMESGRYRMTGGLWSPEVQVEQQFIIYLPIVLR